MDSFFQVLSWGSFLWTALHKVTLKPVFAFNWLGFDCFGFRFFMHSNDLLVVTKSSLVDLFCVCGASRPWLYTKEVSWFTNRDMRLQVGSACMQSHSAVVLAFLLVIRQSPKLMGRLDVRTCWARGKSAEIRVQIWWRLTSDSWDSSFYSTLHPRWCLSWCHFGDRWACPGLACWNFAWNAAILAYFVGDLGWLLLDNIDIWVLLDSGNWGASQRVLVQSSVVLLHKWIGRVELIDCRLLHTFKFFAYKLNCFLQVLLTLGQFTLDLTATGQIVANDCLVIGIEWVRVLGLHHDLIRL